MMNVTPPQPTSNRATFKLLWKTARRRSVNRQKHKRALMRRKSGSEWNGMSIFGNVMALFLAVFVHAILGFSINQSLGTVKILKFENAGRMVVKDYGTLQQISETENNIRKLEEGGDMGHGAANMSLSALRTQLEEDTRRLAKNTAFFRKYSLGGSDEEQKQSVLDHFHKHGSAGFISENNLPEVSLDLPGSLPPGMFLYIGFMLLWWFSMMVGQGEAIELDVQRRRHPMWEWLLSHPVRPLASFAAEMLAPMMANPIYLAAPVFWVVLLVSAHELHTITLLVALLVGLPFAVAASCLHKSIEITVMLRLSSRSRGAVLGLISWVGYAAMMLPIFTMQMNSLKVFLLRGLTVLSAWVPGWPVRALVIGWGAEPSLWQVLISCWVLAGAILGGSLALAYWGVNRGLQGSGGTVPTKPRVMGTVGGGWLKGNVLYRKELLWFWRDKGAVVQAILIPLTIGALQAFNLRHLAETASTHWNGLCGLGILCGTYFLLVLGPRSLSSEGGALWIALTWPQGLEDLLKTKARLWWLLSNIVVTTVFIVTIVMYPAFWWKIVMVWVGWYYFSRSLAEKSVTLVTAPSSSGEMERPSRGLASAAMLGTFAFGAGVVTQTWHVAMLGVVFSSLTAAAMWQNLRARLPYLYDPWSEKLPVAPSLMHGMIGIAIMVECVGLASGVAAGMGGAAHLWQVRSLAYGAVGGVAMLIMHKFLRGRGVCAGDIWNWPGARENKAVVVVGVAVLSGVVLGLLAHGYVLLLNWLPETHTFMADMARYAADNKEQFWWQVLLTVGFAPVAEEYFFRGLLFRALDREWGGWRAMVGSASFFAIYHPPVSWLPVFLLGLGSAWLFKRSGRLFPCVMLHMTYNAMVMFFG